MIRRTRTGAVAAAAAALWLGVYLIVVIGGQRFRTEYLDFGWQLIPWNVLVHDPIGSVWYLHTQPPLWNLLLGGSARLSPFSDRYTLQVLMFGIGLLLAATVAAVVRPLVRRPRSAILLALLATANPEVLHHAFEPTYELAVALLIALVVLTAQRTLLAGDGRWLICCSGAATALVLTRSLYHPVLIVLIAAGTWWPVRRAVTHRQVLAAAAIPVLLVGGWLVKNEVLFGRATTSSWLGMNLQRSTLPIVDRDRLEQLAKDGTVSEVALLGPFGNYDVYRQAMPPCTPAHHHPALTTEGHLDRDGVVIPNFNYECFLPVYDQAMHDFRAVLEAEPGAWWEGRVFSTRMTFATSGLADTSPSPPMRALSTAYRLLRVDATLTASTTSWGTPLYGSFDFQFRFSLLVAGLYALVTSASILAAVRRRSDPALRCTLVVCGALAAYTVIVGIVGELGEQARFRSVTDALVVPIGLVVAHRVLRRWLSAPGATSGSATPDAA